MMRQRLISKYGIREIAELPTPPPAGGPTPSGPHARPPGQYSGACGICRAGRRGTATTFLRAAAIPRQDVDGHVKPPANRRPRPTQQRHGSEGGEIGHLLIPSGF